MTVNERHHSEAAPSANPEPKPLYSWLWLALATLFLLVANGRFSVPVATWLSMLFLLRFMRSQPPRVALPLTWLVLSITWAFQFRGMAPLPGVFYFIFAATFGVVLFMPLLVDRILAPRLRGFTATLVLPCAWVTMEWLVACFTPYGSWGSLAYAQHESLVLLQLIAVTGIYGVSFLITWFASVGCWIWQREFTGASTLRGALIFATVLIFVLLGGGMRLVLFAPDASTVRVASLTERDFNVFEGVIATREELMRGEISEADMIMIRANANTLVDQMLQRADREVQAGAKIVIWGEANGLFLKEHEPAMIARAAEFAHKRGVYLGMSPGVFVRGAAKPLENKIMLFDPAGKLSFESWKAIPVPGPEAAMQATDDGLIKSVDSPHGRLGAAICFDMDFPKHLKQAGRQNVDIMLVPSNDWREIDPWHSHMARFRAIEQGFNLVRHTSNGLSLAADYQGRVLATMDHFVTENRNMVAYVPTRGIRTVYSQIGDLFAWLCIAALLAMIVWSRIKSPLGRGGREADGMGKNS